MNNRIQLQRFIQKRPYLVWHTKPEDVSKEAIVEAVLNYGDFDDIKKIINVLGIREVAKIFHSQNRKKRTNYNSKIAHYFKLYFQKYAS